MRLSERFPREILIGRDPAGAAVEVRIEGTTDADTRVIRLSREEARRLAALVLSQAARLDRSRAGLVLPCAAPIRESA